MSDIKPDAYLNFENLYAAIGFYRDIIPDGFEPVVHLPKAQELIEAARREAIEQCAQLAECYGSVNAADAIRDLLQKDP